MTKQDDHVAGIYKDGSYAAANPSCGEENAVWKAGQVYRMIRKANLSAGTVCEIGCGGGGILAELQRLMPESVYTGVEPMPEAYRVCSTRTKEGLAFRHQTAAELRETFDLVLLLDVFEHVEDYMGFLRSLRPVGKNFIFHIPLDMTVQMVLRDEPIMRVRRDVGHLHYFSMKTALAVLRDTGYTINDWFYSDMRNSSYGAPRRRWLRLPRRFLFRMSPDFAVRLLGGNPMTVLASANPEAVTDSL